MGNRPYLISLQTHPSFFDNLSIYIIRPSHTYMYFEVANTRYIWASLRLTQPVNSELRWWGLKSRNSMLSGDWVLRSLALCLVEHSQLVVWKSLALMQSSLSFLQFEHSDFRAQGWFKNALLLFWASLRLTQPVKLWAPLMRPNKAETACCPEIE